MNKIISALRRPAYALSALALTAGVVLTGLLPGIAAATPGQVQSRSMQMGNATASATGVSYLVSFTPATTGAQSMVIDFCSNSSIIGGSCTAPAGFTAASATFTAGTNTTNWVMGTAAASTLKINKGTGSALTTAAITFTLGNITNPSAVGSFFARVYTYACADYGASCSPASAYSSPTAIGTDLDYGGFALSTVTTINITATVMETLTFCVSKASPTSGCTGLSAPSLILGHGSPQVLDSTVVDTDTAHTQISTNATNGAIVNIKDTSSTTCAGLSRDGGATCGIPAIGAFGTIAPATADFGLNVANGTGGTGGSTASANYGTAANTYGMGAAAFGPYGDTIFNTNNTVCSNVDNLLTFAAQAATTTPAGVYSVNESLIATGTF